MFGAYSSNFCPYIYLHLLMVPFYKNGNILYTTALRFVFFHSSLFGAFLNLNSNQRNGTWRENNVEGRG